MGMMRLRTMTGRSSMGAVGGIGGGIARLAKAVAPKLLRSIPGVGTVAAVAGAGASIYGAATAGSAAANAARVTVGGTTIRPLALLPGGVPLFQRKRKRRTMNPMNVRALKRAVRRLDKAEDLFRKVLSVKGKSVAPGAHAIKPKKGK